MPPATLRAMRKAQGLVLDENGDPVAQTLPLGPQTKEKPGVAKRTKWTKKLPKPPADTIEGAALRELESGKRIMPTKKKRKEVKAQQAIEKAAKTIDKLPVPKEEEECMNLWKWAGIERWCGLPIQKVLIMVPNGAFLGGLTNKARA